MGWTSPKSWVTGYKVLASDLNTFLSANDTALRAGGLAVSGQSAGDVIYASSATQFIRLAIGSDAEVLTLASGVPSWAAGGGGGTENYDSTLTQLLNTTSETSLISCTIPANDMSDGDRLEIWFAVLGKNNSGSTATTTTKFKWGSVVHTFGGGTSSWDGSATEFKIFGLVVVQRIGSDLWLNGEQNAITYTPRIRMWQEQNLGGNSVTNASVMSAPTFDSGQTVAITLELSVAHATTYCKPQAATIIRYKGDT